MFNINGRLIGPGQPCFIIAEAGVNHNGSLILARQLVDAALAAHADAVKFQTFKAGNLVMAATPKAEYQKRTTSADESQLEMLRRLELSVEDHQKLVAHCCERGILFLSTPFEEDSADLLTELHVPAFKIASGEVTNLPLLEHVARFKRPIFLSTGMCHLAEVDAAVCSIRANGNPDLILLHCVSNYPAAAVDVNLRAMRTMADAFGLPVGYSDHTEGNEIALAAVALGACVIEKHLTLDRALPGPDHMASLEPAELAALVRGIRRVETALGSGEKVPAPSEAEIARVARKSIIVRHALAAGSVLQSSMLMVRRPGTGISPALLHEITGRRLRRGVEAGTLLSLEDLE